MSNCAAGAPVTITEYENGSVISTVPPLNVTTGSVLITTQLGGMMRAALNGAINSVTCLSENVSVYEHSEPECDSFRPDGKHMRFRPVITEDDYRKTYSYEVCSNPPLASFSPNESEASLALNFYSIASVLSRAIEIRQNDMHSLAFTADEEKAGMAAIAEGSSRPMSGGQTDTSYGKISFTMTLPPTTLPL